MACFLVPAAEAAVTTIASKVIEKKEQAEDKEKLAQGVNLSELNKPHFSSKLNKLNYMLWGGSGLLAFEHLWHGEIQPFFPFLTATSNPADMTAMLHEMSTVGVSMAALVTGVWAVMTFISGKIENREASPEEALQEEAAK